MKAARVLVCRVGRLPVVETIADFAAAQEIVGGYVKHIELDDGVDLWCNEDAIGLELPLNRVFAAAPRPAPMLFGEPAPIIYADPGLAQPGEPGEWRILGNFFLSRSDDEGDIADLDDASVKLYTALFDFEDVEAARKMNECLERIRSHG